MPYWFFFETVLLCSSGWPQLYNCHASISQGWDHRCEPWAIHSMFPMVQVKKKKNLIFSNSHKKILTLGNISLIWVFTMATSFPPGLTHCHFPLGLWWWLPTDFFVVTPLTSLFHLWPLTLFWFFTFSDVPSLIHPEFSLQLCPLAVPSGSKVLLWYALPAPWHTSASFLFLCGPGREHPWPTHLGMWYSTA